MHRCVSRPLASNRILLLPNNIPRAVNCKCKCEHLCIYRDVSMRFGCIITAIREFKYCPSLRAACGHFVQLIRESELPDFVNTLSICFHMLFTSRLGTGSICGPIGFALEKPNREIKTRYSIYMCGHSID